jgi:hypothetical protein
MRTMYPGIPFSPPAILSDNIGAADTIIKVSDVSLFPDAPNYATIGTDEEGETILYTAKTTNALSGCTRGVEGTAKAWTAGELIARNFTAADQADMIQAIKDAADAAGKAQTAADDAQKAADDGKDAAEAAKKTADTAVKGVNAINEAKGAAGGIATLEEDGTVPAEQRAMTDDADTAKKYVLGVEGGNLYMMEV